VWLFSVGTFDDRTPIFVLLMRREPKGIAALCSAIRPGDYRVFACVIGRQHWPLASRLLYHALGDGSATGVIGARHRRLGADHRKALRAPTPRLTRLSVAVAQARGTASAS
jgi:hypothetical protein